MQFAAKLATAFLFAHGSMSQEELIPAPMLILKVRIMLQPYCDVNDEFAEVWFYPGKTKYYVLGTSGDSAKRVAKLLPTPGLVHVSDPRDPNEQPIICEEFDSIPDETKIVQKSEVSFLEYGDKDDVIQKILHRGLKDLVAEYELKLSNELTAT